MRSGRTIFLDRDGVINQVIFRNGKAAGPRHFSEFAFEPGIEAPIGRLRAAGCKLFVVSNQPDIARGLLSAEQLRLMTDKITATLKIDAVRICPHDDDDRCSCRKPSPGMLLDLAREYDLTLGEACLVGDSWKDTMAARAAGCESILLDRPYNQDDPADKRVSNLSEAVDIILGEIR